MMVAWTERAIDGSQEHARERRRDFVEGEWKGLLFRRSDVRRNLMAEQPIIVVAPSGKSKCKACRYLGTGDPTIANGSQRVGIPGHAAGGVTVFHWCHPSCFAQHCLRVDHAPTGRAKCKADGSEIAKGAIRLLIGYKKESTLYKVENAHRTIVPKLLSLAGRSEGTIHGLSELSLDERPFVEAAIFGGGSASTAAGTGSGAGSEGGGKATPKKRPATAPAAMAPAAAAPAQKRARGAAPAKKPKKAQSESRQPAARRPKASPSRGVSAGEPGATPADGDACPEVSPEEEEAEVAGELCD